MQPKTQTAKRYGVRLRKDRVLERAFTEVYEEILEQHGKHAAGDYMRACLLSGHALHGKQIETKAAQVSSGPVEVDGSEAEQVETSSNTKPNENDVISDNESDASDSGTMVSAERGVGVDAAAAVTAATPSPQPAVGVSIRSSVLRQITGNRESGNQKNEG